MDPERAPEVEEGRPASPSPRVTRLFPCPCRGHPLSHSLLPSDSPGQLRILRPDLSGQQHGGRKVPRAARTPPLPVKPELRVRGSRGKTRGPTGTWRCVGSGRSGELTRSSDAEARFSSQTRGPGSQLPPLAPGAAPRISLSKTNHSERRLLHPDNRAPEPGLPPLHVRRPSTRPFRPLQNQPQLGLLPLRPRRAASTVWTPGPAHWAPHGSTSKRDLLSPTCPTGVLPALQNEWL